MFRPFCTEVHKILVAYEEGIDEGPSQEYSKIQAY